MILYESRKATAECRKAFIESVYGESESLYESVFKNAADFEAFMNTLVKPALPEGWEMSGDIVVDDNGVTRDDVILYKELEDGAFCVLSASIVDGKPWVAPEYAIELTNTKNPEEENEEEDSSYVFSSDDLQEFNSIYNSMVNEYVGRSYDFGTEHDPLKALTSFVGVDAEDKDSLRSALANKLREEQPNDRVATSAVPEENKDSVEAEGEQPESQSVEDDDLIDDSVKQEAKNAIDSWS